MAMNYVQVYIHEVMIIKHRLSIYNCNGDSMTDRLYIKSWLRLVTSATFKCFI